MFEWIIEPLNYTYMQNAIIVSAIIGSLCAFFSSFMVLKGWSLIGDALSHSVMPGVAAAYALNLPYSLGAFFTGLISTLIMILIKHFTYLREDAIIGYVSSSFFAAGLLLISINPTSINVQTILFGNILSITEQDLYQIKLISIIIILFLFFLRKILLAILFDEIYIKTLGINVLLIKLIFFILLSISIILALQTVGAILIMAMIITPGATAWLLTDRFQYLICLSVIFGICTCIIGSWLSYFIDCITGAVIVAFQTLLFLITWIFAPRYGLLTNIKNRNKLLKKFNL